MANRFWVGGSADWNATAGTKWATTSGGAGGAAVPTASDDVFLDATSGAVTVTIAANVICRSIDCTGFTGTLTYSAGGISLTVGTTTAPASNVALKFVAGMTYTIAAITNSIIFQGTFATTAQTVDFANKTIGNLTFSGSTGKWTVTNSTINMPTATLTFSSNSTAVLDLSACTTVTLATMTASTGATKTLILGSGTYNWASGWTTNNGTVSAASATLVVYTAATGLRTFSGGSKTYGTLRYTVADSPGSLAILGANTFDTLEIGPGHRASIQGTPLGQAQFITNPVLSGSPWGYQRRIAGGGSVYLADSAALSLQGDMDFRALVQLDSWASGAVQVLIGKRTSTTANTTSYQFNVSATGTLQLLIATGAANNNTNSSATVGSVGITAGTKAWVRVTRRISDGRVQFWYCSGAIANPTSSDWTQLGSNQTNANTGQDTADIVMLGGYNTTAVASPTSPMIGNYFKAQIRNNVLDNGTGIQADVDLSDPAIFGLNSFTESSSNAATVTKQDLSQPLDGRVHLFSSNSGDSYIIHVPELKTVALDYLRMTDSTAGGAAAGTMYAGSHSVDGGGNTVWQFTAPPVTSGIVEWASGANVFWTGSEEADWEPDAGSYVFSGYGAHASPVAVAGYGIKKSAQTTAISEPTVAQGYGAKKALGSPATASPVSVTSYGVDHHRGWGLTVSVAATQAYGEKSYAAQAADGLVSSADGAGEKTGTSSPSTAVVTSTSSTTGGSLRATQTGTASPSSGAALGSKALLSQGSAASTHSVTSYGIDDRRGWGLVALTETATGTLGTAEHSSQGVTDLIHSIAPTAASHRSGQGANAEITIATAARGFNGNIYWDEDPGYWGDDPGTWPAEAEKIGLGATVLISTASGTAAAATHESAGVLVAVSTVVATSYKTAAGRAAGVQVTAIASTFAAVRTATAANALVSTTSSTGLKAASSSSSTDLVSTVVGSGTGDTSQDLTGLTSTALVVAVSGSGGSARSSTASTASPQMVWAEAIRIWGASGFGRIGQIYAVSGTTGTAEHTSQAISSLVTGVSGTESTVRTGSPSVVVVTTIITAGQPRRLGTASSAIISSSAGTSRRNASQRALAAHPTALAAGGGARGAAHTGQVVVLVQGTIVGEVIVVGQGCLALPSGIAGEGAHATTGYAAALLIAVITGRAVRTQSGLVVLILAAHTVNQAVAVVMGEQVLTTHARQDAIVTHAREETIDAIERVQFGIAAEAISIHERET